MVLTAGSLILALEGRWRRFTAMPCNKATQHPHRGPAPGLLQGPPQQGLHPRTPQGSFHHIWQALPDPPQADVRSGCSHAASQQHEARG